MKTWRNERNHIFQLITKNDEMIQEKEKGKNKMFLTKS